jgi:hypothetical protein
MILAIIALLILLVVPASAQEKDWEKEWNALVAGAKKEGKVVVAGFPNPELRKDIPARFKQRFGIPVEYIGANSNETVARLRSERRAGLQHGNSAGIIKGLKIELTNLSCPLFFKEGNSSLWQREARRDFSKGL